MNLMRLEFRFFMATIVMIIYMIIWRLFINYNYLLGLLTALIVTAILTYLYKKELIGILKELKKGKNKNEA